MKIRRKISQIKNRGYALMMTVVFIGIALLLLAGMMRWTSGSSLQTERNNLFHDSTGGADAATELTMAYMWRDFYNQALGTASSYTSYLPDQEGWPVQFYFSNGGTVPNHTGVVEQPTAWQALNAFGAPYAGLSGFAVECSVTATATTSNQPYAVSSTVEQKFQLAAIPIFQFAVFYNLNMEIDPGQPMSLTGPVFSNEGIWARGLGTYDATISAVGAVATNGTDPYVSGKSDSNESVFDNGITTNADSLTLPLGTTNNPSATRSLLGLPPSGTAPYSVAGQDYFIDEANIIISNSPSGQLSAFYQDPNATTPITPIPYNAGSNNYTFVTNVTFYDFREGKTVNAVQIDVGLLNFWLSSSSGGLGLNNKMELDNGHYINSVYVYNNNSMTSTTLPAVRVDDGATLPADGLTVVTPDPLYVLGDYNAHGTSLNNGTNVANTAPAALIGDAITVLSQNWDDSTYVPGGAGSSTSARVPAPTTINAATFEGIVPSNGANYSGGVENFLRLLENWTGSIPLTYNGSIVVMFPSQYATNNWSGSYYGVPKRNWAFDLNFLSQNGLPPLTPEVRAIIRQSWAVIN